MFHLRQGTNAGFKNSITPCGSKLAREEALSVDTDIAWLSAFAGKPPPHTGFVFTSGPTQSAQHKVIAIFERASSTCCNSMIRSSDGMRFRRYWMSCRGSCLP